MHKIEDLGDWEGLSHVALANYQHLENVSTMQTNIIGSNNRLETQNMLEKNMRKKIHLCSGQIYELQS